MVKNLPTNPKYIVNTFLWLYGEKPMRIKKKKNRATSLWISLKVNQSESLQKLQFQWRRLVTTNETLTAFWACVVK